MTKRNSLHKAKNSLHDNSLAPAEANICPMDIEECRKYFKGLGLTDDEIEKIRNETTISINTILDEMINDRTNNKEGIDIHKGIN